MIRFHCPNCKSEMEVDESFAGRGARCPTCGTNMKVPKKGEVPPQGPAAKPTPARPGATTVNVEGEKVEILPPLEFMVIVSMVFLGASVLCLLVCGVLLSSTLQYPWTLGAALGGVLALLGLLTALPAYHNVRRSRGRKRGCVHALAGMGAGGGLLLICAVVGLVGLAQILGRPTCEENLKRIYGGLRLYADKHDGALPRSLQVLVDEKYVGQDTLTCPAYKVQIGTQTYSYVPDINLKNPLWPPDIMVVSDGPRPAGSVRIHEDGMLRVLLLDGKIVLKNETEWAAYQKTQGEKWNDILNKIRKPKPPETAPPKEGPASPAPAAPAAPPAAPGPSTPAPAAPATPGGAT